MSIFACSQCGYIDNTASTTADLHQDFVESFAAGHGLQIPKQAPGPKNGKTAKRICPACKLPKLLRDFYSEDCYCKPCRQAQSARSYEKRMGRAIKTADKRHGNRGNRTPPPAHSTQSDFNDTGRSRLPLIRAARAGDQEAAEELYRRFKVVCK